MTITRRSFLQTCAATAMAARSGIQTALSAEAKPASRLPDLPEVVIDTHTHFYDPTRPEGVPWPGKGDPTLYRPTLPEHFRQVAEPLGVTGTVVVEASPWLEDNQWLLDLAAKDRFLVGIVGNLVPGGEGFADHLARFKKNPLYRGFRIPGSGLTKKLEQPAFVADMKRVIDADLEVDINGGPAMLPEIAALVRKLPELRIVINHVANVRNDGKTLPDEWLQGMRDCSQGKRVFCKVSAIAEGATVRGADGKASKDPGYYAPLLESVWTIWGAERLVYGSNWPVCLRATTYADQLRAMLEFFKSKGAEATQRFFAGNARSAYGWLDRTPDRS